MVFWVEHILLSFSLRFPYINNNRFLLLIYSWRRRGGGQVQSPVKVIRNPYDSLVISMSSFRTEPLDRRIRSYNIYKNCLKMFKSWITLAIRVTTIILCAQPITIVTGKLVHARIAYLSIIDVANYCDWLTYGKDFVLWTLDRTNDSEHREPAPWHIQ